MGPWARGRVRGQGAELEGRRQGLGAGDRGQRGSFPRASGSRENFTFYLSSVADGVLVTWLVVLFSLLKECLGEIYLHTFSTHSFLPSRDLFPFFLGLFF